MGRRSNGRAAAAVAVAVAVDGLALLGERAALGDLTRQGAISCGGSTRLVRTADSWLAVSLARPDDVAALEAWLCADVPLEDPWPAVERIAGASDAATLDDRASLLGLPIAALASVGPPETMAFGLPIGAARVQETGGSPRASTGHWWSTCPPCGPGHCAGNSSPRPGPPWSRSSRRPVPTVPGRDRRRSST